MIPEGVISYWRQLAKEYVEAEWRACQEVNAMSEANRRRHELEAELRKADFSLEGTVRPIAVNGHIRIDLLAE